MQPTFSTPPRRRPYKSISPGPTGQMFNDAPSCCPCSRLLSGLTSGTRSNIVYFAEVCQGCNRKKVLLRLGTYKVPVTPYFVGICNRSERMPHPARWRLLEAIRTPSVGTGRIAKLGAIERVEDEIRPFVLWLGGKRAGGGGTTRSPAPGHPRSVSPCGR